ncbi:MAG TPA: glycosyltransferase [Gemmatimonadales bacterium]|jgi:rhamnosyltransferase subunit B|nr:glycosyltransferase [Gemmatimonadales bacterium]
MRFLLTPVGSGGDVHPFVGIGRALQARGHEVILFGAEPFRGVVETGGLVFVPTGTAEQYHAATMDPDLWHPRRGIATVLKLVKPALESSLAALATHYIAGQTMVVGHPLGFHTRIFEEKTGAPAATIQLAPSSIRSCYQIPALPPGVDISWLPLWVKRIFWVLVDRVAIDPLIEPELNRLRAANGLPPVHRVFREWINSPRLVVGLFPDWFGPRQPDWPASFRHASFPLWDDPGGAPVDPELAAFLDQGTPPIIASPGTANRHATAFFAAIQAALGRLGRRGLFLTGYPEQLPPDLPSTILVRKYAPFSEVLPYAGAFIHHGGIGTLAQGLASGKPQLIMPMAFDQPDNALRATRLGVARWLSPAKFTAERVTSALGGLLESAAVATAGASWKERLRQVNGIEIACDLLEQEAKRSTA